MPNMNDLAMKMVQPIMADWEKQRQRPIQGTQRDEWQAAQGKIMGLPSSLFNDARLVALNMTRDDNRDPSHYTEDELTKDLIPKYWDAVINLAKNFSLMPDQAKNKLLSLDQATVLPGRGSNQGGEGGGAAGVMPAGGGAGAPPPGTPPMGAPPAGGAMAFNLNKMKKTANPRMYVQRDDGDSRHFRLRDTLVGRIMSGSVAFFGPDGAERRIVFKRPAKGKVQIPRSGPTAQEAIRAEETLPSAIAKKLAEFLKGIGRRDAIQSAHLMVERSSGLGRVDLLPCVIATHAGQDNSKMDEACLLAFAIACGCDGILEPEEVTALRSEIGSEMGPIVDRIVQSMTNDGIECAVKKFPMPICTHEGRESRMAKGEVDKDIGGAPRILDVQETGVSADISSLIMTAMNNGGDPRARIMALDRVSALLCRFPDFFETRIGDISSQELLAAAAGLAGKSAVRAKVLRLAKLMELLTSNDDAAFVEEYHNDKAGKLLVAELIGAKDRFMIMDAAPEMCVHDGLRKKVAERFFCKLDPTSQKAIDVISTVAEWWAMREYSPKTRHAVVSCMMRALLVSKDQRLAAACAKTPCHELAAMGGLRLAMLGAPGLEATKVNLDDCPKRAKAVGLAYLCLKSPAEYHCQPMDIALMFGRDAAMGSMSARKMDWHGAEVGGNVDGDPLIKAKLLEQAKDYDQLLKLLATVSKMIRKSKNPELEHAARYIVDVLDKAGMTGRLLEVFMPTWGGRGG